MDDKNNRDPKGEGPIDTSSTDPSITGQFVLGLELFQNGQVQLRTQNSGVHPAIVVHWLTCYIEKLDNLITEADKQSIAFFDNTQEPTE